MSILLICVRRVSGIVPWHVLPLLHCKAFYTLFSYLAQWPHGRRRGAGEGLRPSSSGEMGAPVAHLWGGLIV
jgi:hypothetical protein